MRALAHGVEIAGLECRDDLRQALIAAADEGLGEFALEFRIAAGEFACSALRSIAGAAVGAFKKRLKASITWAASIGLPRCASMPAARHFSRSSLMTFAVSAMMGRRLAPRLSSSSRMRRVAVNPSMTGIWQSIKHGIEVRCGHALQGLGAVVRNGHFRRQILQHALRHALIDRVVLDQQDLVAAKGRHGLCAVDLMLGACGVLPVRT